MNAIEIAELLEYSAIGNLGDFPYVADAAKELRRLSAIEQAATALIKCRGRYHAELNTKALAEALGLAIHSPLLNTPFMIKTAPEVIWLQVSDNPHESALPFPANHADVTWCSESVMPSEVQYIRADLAAGPCGEPVAPGGVYFGQEDWDSAAEYADEGNLQIGDKFTLNASYFRKAKFIVADKDENERCVVAQIDGQLYSALVLPSSGANQCAEQAEDPDRPSAVELQDAEVGIPKPVTELINPA